MSIVCLSPPPASRAWRPCVIRTDEHQQSLDHAAQRRVELPLQRQLQAAHGDGGEEERDRHAPEGAEVGQQHHQDGQEAVAAGDQREQVVAGAVTHDQHPAGQPGQRAAQGESQQQVAVRSARRAGRPSAGSCRWP